MVRTERWKQAQPQIKRWGGILARVGSVIVITWMLYVTYQQRHILLDALQFQPLFLVPGVVLYIAGFFLAVVSWHTLLGVFGERYRFGENYRLYAYMSAYRNVPLPYLWVASLLYSYHQRGTEYKTTGLVVVSTSVLHIVSGVIIFSVVSLTGLAIQADVVVYGAVVASALVALVLHPSLFTRLVYLAQSNNDTEQSGERPPAVIPWRVIGTLLAINILLLGSGGTMIFFCARAILDIPWGLLPVFLAAWSLVVSATNLICWLPSDFGLSQLLMVAMFQPYLPVAYVMAILAMLRISTIVLDLVNVLLATLVHSLKEEQP
jgi:hypothetical protein